MLAPIKAAPVWFFLIELTYHQPYVNKGLFPPLSSVNWKRYLQSSRMRQVTQHGSGEGNFLEWWTVDSSDVSVLSSSSLWPSLIPAAWRITFKTLASPESWSVHQSSAWHSSSSLCPPHLRLPRVLIPLTPHGWPQGRWFLCLLFGSLFLRFKSRSLCRLKSILSTQRLISTELVSLGNRGRRQKGNGKACFYHYYCHFSGQQNFFFTHCMELLDLKFTLYIV